MPGKLLWITKCHEVTSLSEQMFKKHIKKWGLSKNMTATEKDHALKRLNAALRSVGSFSQNSSKNILRDANNGKLPEPFIGRLRRSRANAQDDAFLWQHQSLFEEKLDQLYAKLLNKDIHMGDRALPDASSIFLKARKNNVKWTPCSPGGVIGAHVEQLLVALATWIRSTQISKYGRHRERLDGALEDVRIYVGICAFTKSSALVERLYTSHFETMAAEGWLVLALLPFLSSGTKEDRWVKNMLEVLMLAIYWSTIPRLEAEGPVIQATRLLERRYLSAKDQMTISSSLLRLYHAESMDNSQYLVSLTLNRIRSARKAKHFQLAWETCEVAMDELGTQQTPDDHFRAVLLYEYARTSQCSGNFSRAIEHFRRTATQAHFMGSHRLRIRALLRLAQCYDALAKTDQAQAKYLDAFQVAMHQYGTEHSHTMLAFVRLKDFGRFHQRSMTDMIPEEDYRVASNHYQSLNDLVTEDETVEEIAKDDFRPRSPRIQIKQEPPSDEDDDLQEIPSTRFYQTPANVEPWSARATETLSEQSDADDLLEVDKMAFDEAVER